MFLSTLGGAAFDVCCSRWVSWLGAGLRRVKVAMAWSGWQGDRTPGWIVRHVRARRYCECCGVDGARQVDHIVCRAEGGKNELSNFQLLCDDCHDRKTRSEHARGQQRRSARGKYDPGGHPAYL
ncbi:HNH endonuclease [Gordonia phage AndPeggy]|nr:HNH endonuclease [Gordonia phage AndPeggy]